MADPDLAELSVFMAVAQARSFRGAAAVRGVSASSLSEALRRLEVRLGVRLLNRTTRSVTPTEAGERLLARLSPALEEVAAALDDLDSVRGSPHGMLRLNVPTAVAALVLPGLLERFLKGHPGITLEVRADDSFIDVLAAGFDAGVRYGERLERDMIAVPLGPRVQHIVIAASPAYLTVRGRPTHPRDLLNHACIRHRFASGVAFAWEFERDAEVVKISPTGPLVTNTPELEVTAAVQGLGFVYSFEGYLEAALAAGALEPVLADWCPSFPGPFLYYPSRRLMPGPLRAFVDFIKAEAGGSGCV